MAIDISVLNDIQTQNNLLASNFTSAAFPGTVAPTISGQVPIYDTVTSKYVPGTVSGASLPWITVGTGGTYATLGAALTATVTAPGTYNYIVLSDTTETADVNINYQTVITVMLMPGVTVDCGPYSLFIGNGTDNNIVSFYCLAQSADNITADFYNVSGLATVRYAYTTTKNFMYSSDYYGIINFINVNLTNASTVDNTLVISSPSVAGAAVMQNCIWTIPPGSNTGHNGNDFIGSNLIISINNAQSVINTQPQNAVIRLDNVTLTGTPVTGSEVILGYPCVFTNFNNNTSDNTIIIDNQGNGSIINAGKVYSRPFAYTQESQGACQLTNCYLSTFKIVGNSGNWNSFYHCQFDGIDLSSSNSEYMLFESCDLNVQSTTFTIGASGSYWKISNSKIGNETNTTTWTTQANAIIYMSQCYAKVLQLVVASNNCSFDNCSFAYNAYGNSSFTINSGVQGTKVSVLTLKGGIAQYTDNSGNSTNQFSIISNIY